MPWHNYTYNNAETKHQRRILVSIITPTVWIQLEDLLYVLNERDQLCEYNSKIYCTC